jgi:hypothetical protein
MRGGAGSPVRNSREDADRTGSAPWRRDRGSSRTTRRNRHLPPRALVPGDFSFLRLDCEAPVEILEMRAAEFARALQAELTLS